MKSADEIRAEIARVSDLLNAGPKSGLKASRDWRIELALRRDALTWVLSDPAPIHADPPTTQEPQI